MRPFKAFLTAACAAAVLAAGFTVGSPPAEAEPIRIGALPAGTSWCR